MTGGFSPRRFTGALSGRAAVLSLAVAVAACAAPASDIDAVPTGGRLVIVGGALDAETAPVWEAVLEGRDGDGPLCVLPTASGVPARSMESARDALNRHGGTDVAEGVMITEGDTLMASAPEVVSRLETCSGFWFVGGQQSRITATLAPDGRSTPALEAIRRRHQEGAVVAGTSAGAAIMSPLMIAGGSSEEALAEGIRRGAEGEGVVLTDGLGFFPVGVVDQHFLARGRIGRLLVTVLEHPDVDAGFGIDENTALVVDGRTARVVGASGVVVVDGRRAGPGGPVRLALAGAGDVIDAATLEVTPASGKRPIEAVDAQFSEVGIFERWAFLDALVVFARRLDVGMVVPLEGMSLVLQKGDGFVAVREDEGEGVSSAPPGFSAGPFLVELESR